MDLAQHIHSGIVLVTGHYGCGKTNLTANMAAELARAGIAVSVIDLDIVNPYFRISDYTSALQQLGVKMIAPNFAGTTLDTPSLSPQIQTVLAEAASGAGGAELSDASCGEPLDGASHEEALCASPHATVSSNSPRNVTRTNSPYSVVFVDVGGDPDGATALGRYRTIIQNAGYQMLYVVNQRRFQTSEVQEALGLMREIEQVSGLSATHIVSNTHLKGQTTASLIAGSVEYAQAVAREAGLPLEFVTAPRAIALEAESAIARISESTDEDSLDIAAEAADEHAIGNAAGNAIPVFPVDVYVKTPWD